MLDYENLLEKVIQEEHLVLLQFMTSWCSYCAELRPDYEKVMHRERERDTKRDGFVQTGKGSKQKHRHSLSYQQRSPLQHDA